jgi:DNA-binding IclR family transcriptional regulator
MSYSDQILDLLRERGSMTRYELAAAIGTPAPHLAGSLLRLRRDGYVVEDHSRRRRAMVFGLAERFRPSQTLYQVFLRELAKAPRSRGFGGAQLISASYSDRAKELCDS